MKTRTAVIMKNLLLLFLLFTNSVTIALAQDKLMLSHLWKFKTGDSAVWAKPDFNDLQWTTISTKKYWEEQGYSNYDGYAWYRKTFKLPASWKKKVRLAGGVYLKYEYADDVEEVFVNGVSVGKMGDFPPNLKIVYGKSRKFEIPAHLLKFNGVNLIAVRVFDNGGDGGILSGHFTLNPVSAMDKLELKVDVANSNWVFAENEQITFDISPKIPLGILPNFNLICKITKDDYTPVDSFAYQVKTTNTSFFSKKIAFSLKDAGFYRITLYGEKDKQKTDELKFNIGYNPEKIVSAPDPQPDFDDFWNGTLAALKQVAPNFKMTLLADKSNEKKDVYHVTMQSLGNVTIEGYYAAPKDKTKKYPTIITFLGYGGSSAPLNPDNWGGYCEFVLSTRGQGIQLSDNHFGDWIGYGLESKETYYYRGAFMDLVRGIDFLCSRPEVDERCILAEGGSQGGAFTLAACALDNRIKAAAPYIPFLSDFPDYFKIAPWPRNVFDSYLKEHPDKDWAYLYKLLSYFDIKNFAGKIKCPIIMGVGLQDNVCPPHINFSGYNLIKTDKHYYVYPQSAHAVGDGWWDVRNKFFAKYADGHNGI